MTAQARTFIEAEQAGNGNVVKACELLDVSRSAYYGLGCRDEEFEGLGLSVELG